MVVLNGDLTVAGEVRGDVTVARGDLQLESGAVVAGDAVVTAGRLVNRGARVSGEMRVVDEGRAIGMQDGVPGGRPRAAGPLVVRAHRPRAGGADGDAGAGAGAGRRGRRR